MILGLTAGFMTLLIMLFGAYLYLQSDLPDLAALRDIRYQSPMKVYSKDGLLIGQFGEQIRYPVKLETVPKRIIEAVLAAEDNRFYSHPGVDYQGLLRASFSFLKTGEKRQGGSTITMQVARNFFLSNEKTFLRKLREIMLAIKIESELPKDQILELYLNKIYLGNHAYGIAAAAEVYYNKTIDQLTLAEVATLAGLPKAPSTFNPIVNPDRALVRRNYILGRMQELGFINTNEFSEAQSAPNTAALHERVTGADLPYIAEIVRTQMVEQYGENAYNTGYRVYTTIDAALQAKAEEILRSHLHQFDEHRRFRPIQEHIDLSRHTKDAEWDRELDTLGRMGETVPALILRLNHGDAQLYLGHGERMTFTAEQLSWAYRYLNGGRNRKNDEEDNKPLAAGDVLRLRKDEGKWKLTQIPEVGAALVALQPMDGAVLAVAGGYDFRHSKFNRAIQSKRQPGSGFKPVIYATALKEGMTPSSVINDSPVTIGKWSPQNASNRFYGPTPLRTALTYSRNVVAVKLLQKVGIPDAIRTARDMGFEDSELPRYYPLALGSGSASPLRMAQMYAVFANGGFRIDPYFISRVETDAGMVVYQATPLTACPECDPAASVKAEGVAPRVLSPTVHFQMNSMLQDVVRNGTARKALELKRQDIAGKTGTTNDFHDAWFNGYVPGLVAISWFGYDSYRSLGKGQMGGELALPMWIDFMKIALKDIPDRPFTPPPGLTPEHTRNHAPREGEENAQENTGDPAQAGGGHQDAGQGNWQKKRSTIESLF